MQVCVVCSERELIDVELEKEYEAVSDSIAGYTGYLFCPKCGLVYKEVE